MTAPLRHARRGPLRRRDLPAWMAWPVVAVLTGTSFGLAYFDLTKRSLWFDEGYTWLTARQSPHAILALSRSRGYHLVPYFFIVHQMTVWFGDSETVLRLPSVIAGALTVPVLYLLACRLGGRLAGVYACILFVVSEPLVFWQQNARDYTLVVFLATASTLAAVVACQEERIWMFLVWGAVTGLGCFTHPEMLLLLPPQIGVLFVWSRSWRTRLVLLGTTALGALVSLPVLLEAAHSSVYEVTPLSPPNHGSATEIATFLASGAGTTAAVTPADHALLGLTFALVIIGVAMLATDIVDRGCTQLNLGLGLSLAWLVLPPVLAWIVSEVGRPDFLDRYVILCLPATATAIALVLIRIPPRVLGMFAVVYLTIFRAGVLVGSYHWPVNDYRGVTREILTQTRLGDCITFSSSPGRMLWDYYVPRIEKSAGGTYYAPPQILPVAHNGAPATVLHAASIPDILIRRAQSRAQVGYAYPYCSRIWLFQSHAGSPTGSAADRTLFQSLSDLKRNLGLYYRPASQTSNGGLAVIAYDRIPTDQPRRP